jgi:hypothetical protein
MVIFNTLYILVFLFALGLPICLLVSRPNSGFSGLILAPHLGFVCLAILVTNAYLLNVAVSKTVWPMAGLSLLALGCGIWGYRIRFRSLRSRSRVFRFSAKPFIPVILLVLTILIYALPFLLNPRLEYYAYSGTDGDAYITTAEYQMMHGVRDGPALDLLHPFSALIKGLTLIQYNQVDKPATMVTLAFFSALLHKLPHQLFSSFMLLASVLLFASCYALARSLNYTEIFSGFAAFLGTVSPSLLALTSNTYLGASLTLPLMPLLFLLSEDVTENNKQAALFAATYSAYWLISPPNWLLPPAYLGMYLLYRIWKKFKSNARTLLMALLCFSLTLAAVSAIDFGVFIRYTGVLNYAFGPTTPITPALRSWSWAMFWHAIGVGDIISSPASTLDLAGRIAFIATLLVALGYLSLCIIRRRFSVLFFSYLTFWLVVLIGGVLGGFHAFEVLARVSQQVVFLHALVYMGLVSEFLWLLGQRESGAREIRRPLVCALLIVVLFVSIYPFRSFQNFERISLFSDPQRTNQYESSAFADREKFAR